MAQSPEWSQLPEIQLQKNEPSPYRGVLIPESNYRTYKLFEDKNIYLEERVKELNLPDLPTPTMDSSTVVMAAILSFLIGYFIAPH